MSDRGLAPVEKGERGVLKALPSPARGFEERLESTVARVYVFLTSMSFRYKIAAALVAVLCLAIVSLGAVSFSQQKRVLLQEMQKRAEVLVRQLGGTAKTALLAPDDLGLAATVREIGKMPGVEYVVIHDDIGSLAEAFNEMILKLREKLHMEKYLSATTLQLIRRFRDVDELKLGGEHRFVVILFSDVRGFTSMTEKLDADEIVGLLNLYLNLQSEVVYQHKGTVDKFVGDEIMALFTGDAAQASAARAASEIQRYVASLNAARAAKGLREIQIGIGLNAGEVVMGNMGSERRMDYTVIGDAVNVAARLCGAAAPGQIVMSKAVHDALGAEAETKALEPLTLKGKKDPFPAFALVSMKGAQRRHFRRPARLPASFVYAGLSEERHLVTVRDIGCQGCVVETGHAIGVGSMLGLTVDLPELAFLRDVPAVARHLRHLESGYLVGLTFPELPAEAAGRLSEWVHRVSTELPHQAHAAI